MRKVLRTPAAKAAPVKKDKARRHKSDILWESLCGTQGKGLPLIHIDDKYSIVAECGSWGARWRGLLSLAVPELRAVRRVLELSLGNAAVLLVWNEGTEPAPQPKEGRGGSAQAALG